MHADITTQKKMEPGRGIDIIINIAVWIYVVTAPVLFRHNDAPASLENYLRDIIFPLTDCFAFYVNYFYFVPIHLRNFRWWTFLGENALLIVLLVVVREVVFIELFPLPLKAIKMAEADIFHLPWLIYLRSVINFTFVIFIAASIRLSLQWKISEDARQEAELRRTEAEIRSLKSQINPHFLLNTLNGIYALTAIDTDKAQQAIQDLAKLLRFLLYEHKENFVPLKNEVDFLQNYVQLMRLRLNDNVKIVEDFQLPDCELQVAPHIFICLVENALKHGVSPTSNSYVRIHLKADASSIVFSVENSFFPKDSSDKRPGGIGLLQVERRLKLLYRGRHNWEHGIMDGGKGYFSEITIKL